MRTAEVMGPGESAWFINGITSEYQSFVTPGSSGLLIESTLGYARSFGGHTEFSLLMPYGLFTPDTSSGNSYAGSRGITGILKHSFTDPVYAQGTAFAFTLMYTLYPGQASTNITSGETLHGLEFNLSHWAQTTGFHLNMGYGKMDTWSEAALPPFVATEAITASTGVEVGLSDSMTFSLQALAREEIATKNENLLSSAVFTYSVSKHTIFTFGGAWGIPANRSRPNTTYLFGISYSPQAKRKTRYEIQGSSEQLQAQNQQILQRVADIDQRMERLENSLMVSPKDTSHLTPKVDEAPAQTGMMQADTPENMELSQAGTNASAPPSAMETTSTGTIAVELVFAGSDPAHEQSLGDSLRHAGYKTVIRHEAKSSKPKKTHVFYRSGMSQEAVSLGHMLQGNQIVVKGNLPDGVDIRVTVGADLSP